MRGLSLKKGAERLKFSPQKNNFSRHSFQFCSPFFLASALSPLELMGDAAAFLRRIPKRERDHGREEKREKGRGSCKLAFRARNIRHRPRRTNSPPPRPLRYLRGKEGGKKLPINGRGGVEERGIEEEDRGRQKCTSMRGRSHAHTAEGGGGGRSRLGECCFGKKRGGKRKRGASQSSHFFAGLFFSPFSRPNSPGRREKSRRRPSACLGGKGGEQNFCHSFLWSKFLTGRGDF